jgi:hypothetical protein
MLNESCLHRVKVAGLAETFDCDDFGGLLHRSKGEAAVHTSTVDMHGAGATLPVITSLFGSCQVQRFA